MVFTQKLVNQNVYITSEKMEFILENKIIASDKLIPRVNHDLSHLVAYIFFNTQIRLFSPVGEQCADIPLITASKKYYNKFSYYDQKVFFVELHHYLESLKRPETPEIVKHSLMEYKKSRESKDLYIALEYYDPEFKQNLELISELYTKLKDFSHILPTRLISNFDELFVQSNTFIADPFNLFFEHREEFELLEGIFMRAFGNILFFNNFVFVLEKFMKFIQELFDENQNLLTDINLTDLLNKFSTFINPYNDKILSIQERKSLIYQFFQIYYNVYPENVPSEVSLEISGYKLTEGTSEAELSQIKNSIEYIEVLQLLEQIPNFYK